MEDAHISEMEAIQSTQNIGSWSAVTVADFLKL
jgi:hypothetical protein